MKNDYPGIEGKPFKIVFEKDQWKKGDVLSTGRAQVKVTQVYKNTLWRRILVFFGFRVKLLKGEVLVKNI